MSNTCKIFLQNKNIIKVKKINNSHNFEVEKKKKKDNKFNFCNVIVHNAWKLYINIHSTIQIPNFNSQEKKNKIQMSSYQPQGR